MLQSDTLSGLPGIRHGFFTREGGVSTGLYASRNCGPGSGDDAANVRENRRRAAADLGLDPAGLVTAHQVHSPDAVVVEAPWDMGTGPEADALVTRTPGMAVGVLTADCAPVLLADAGAGVVAAAHAGWRGALAGVLEAAVETMARQGAERHAIRAVVGPCIHQPSYEVGADLQAEVTGDDPAAGAYFVRGQRQSRYMFDLPGYVRGRLMHLGLESVEVLPFDTRARDDLFFSYRRATLAGESDYGRQISAIGMPQ